MAFIKLKPAKGLKVKKPNDLTWLNEEGEEVEKDSYWIRRLKDGDVELITPKTRKKVDDNNI